MEIFAEFQCCVCAEWSYSGQHSPLKCGKTEGNSIFHLVFRGEYPSAVKEWNSVPSMLMQARWTDEQSMPSTLVREDRSKIFNGHNEKATPPIPLHSMSVVMY
jgi:hypothetical protein